VGDITVANNSQAYNLGRLMAALEAAGALPGWNVYTKGIQEPHYTIVEGVKGLAERGKMNVIEDIMGELDAIPTNLTIKEQGDYALGYHQYKSEKSKPELKTERYEIKLTPTEKAWLLANGGAERVRSLIKREMES
jgi:hypothetical protein